LTFFFASKKSNPSIPRIERYKETIGRRGITDSETIGRRGITDSELDDLQCKEFNI
jgi:hypothetical protein